MELSINAVVCQNHRIANNGCHKCSDACINKAIEVVDGRVQQGSGSCTECGLCRSVCPTKAIYFINEHRYPLNEQNEVRAVYCRKLNENGYVNCLGSIDALEIILLGLNGKSCIYMDKEFCNNCNEQVMPYLKKELVRANVFLESIGKKPVRVAFTKKAVMGCMDRRDVFDLLFIKARQKLSDAIPVNVDRVNLRKQVVELMEQTSELADIQNDNIFYGIKCTEKCTLCGMCAKVCPSGALQRNVDIQLREARLEFSVNGCNGCGSCVKLCTNKCLQISSELCSQSDIINNNAKVINRRSMELCSKCGQELVMVPEKLCSFCQALQKNKMQAIY